LISIVQEDKSYPHGNNGEFRAFDLGGERPPVSPSMRVFLIGVAWLGLWLTALPAFAQVSGAADVQASDKASHAAPNTAAPPPTSQTPMASPDEISHQAMVEEQERRDREEQAERDRDDQG
jgi:hypothetical protein